MLAAVHLRMELPVEGLVDVAVDEDPFDSYLCKEGDVDSGWIQEMDAPVQSKGQVWWGSGIIVRGSKLI